MFKIKGLSAAQHICLDNLLMALYVIAEKENEIMHFEKETYYKERPDHEKVRHIPTNKIYESMSEACRVTGISPYVMRKLIIAGDEWERQTPLIFLQKEVKCVKTGKIYKSIAEAARSGCNSYELTGRFTPPKPRKYMRKRKSFIYDDRGGKYESLTQICIDTGFVEKRVRQILKLDPERKFRTAWIYDRRFRCARFDGTWYWVNGSVPAATLTDFRKVLGFMGKRVTLEEARNMVGDLFK